MAEIPTLSGKDTAVTLDAGFVEALGSLKLTPAPVGSAEISKAGVASFPITGGNVTYYTPGTESPYVQGEVDHDGSGLSLTGGGKTVELTDFVIDPGKSVLTGKVTVDGAVAAESAPLFFLDGRTLKPLRDRRRHRDPGGHDRQAQAGGGRPAQSDLRCRRARRRLRDRRRQDHRQYRVGASSRLGCGDRPLRAIAGFSTRYQLATASRRLNGSTQASAGRKRSGKRSCSCSA